MTTLFRVTFGLLVVLSALPSSAEEKKAWGVNCSIDYKSSYLLSIGIRATKDAEPVMQSVCALWHRSGLYGGVWASQSLTHPGSDKSLANEVDYFVGWSGRPFKEVPLRLTLDLEYYDLANPSLFDWKGDMFDANVRLAYEKWVRLTPFAEVHYLGETDATSFESGWYVTGGMLGSIPLHRRLEWRLRADFTHRWDLGMESAQFLGGRSSLAWKINNHITLRVPEVRGIYPLQSENEKFFAVGVGIDFKF